jgi:hypothetical protein
VLPLGTVTFGATTVTFGLLEFVTAVVWFSSGV